MSALSFLEKHFTSLAEFLLSLNEALWQQALFYKIETSKITSFIL